MASSYDERPDVSSRKSDLSLAATLISLFDFNADGNVTREEWERGLGTLLLGGLLEDNGLFDQLLARYDTAGTGAVQLNKIRDVLPIDPRISVLLQQLVHSVAGCREYVAAATKKQQRDVEMRSQRGIGGDVHDESHHQWRHHRRHPSPDIAQLRCEAFAIVLAEAQNVPAPNQSRTRGPRRGRRRAPPGIALHGVGRSL